MRNLSGALRVLPIAAALTLIAGSAPAEQQIGGYANDLVPLPAEGVAAGVPLGGLAGGAESELASKIQNPNGTSKVAMAQAVDEGRKLFVSLNCADCHGFKATGGMGPNLTDKYWRYGGTPAAIFKSIFEGRPKGMPAWGKALPAKDIWQIVAYIESLGGSYAPSFYQPSLQGDRQGELVAPEIDFEQSLAGSPPYPGGSAGKATSAPASHSTSGGAKP